jgi:phage baseplate assembly protein V
MAMFGRARITGVDDAKGVQTLQIGLNGETRDAVESFQAYGFTGVPIPGAEAVVAFVGGGRDNGYVLAVNDRRHRIKGLQQGEVAVYNNAGASIVLKADGSVLITAPGGVTVDTPNLAVTGDIIDQSAGAGKSMAAMRQIFNGHTHVNPEGGNVPPPNEQM